MSFFTNKIVTKSISLEDAVKNAKDNPKKVRSLDEIVASIQGIKTASTQAEVKTASTEKPAVETPKTETAKVETKEVIAKAVPPAVTVKVADFGSVMPAPAAPAAPAATATPTAVAPSASPIAPAKPAIPGMTPRPQAKAPVNPAKPMVPGKPAVRPMGAKPAVPGMGAKPASPAVPGMPAPAAAAPAPAPSAAAPAMANPAMAATKKTTLKIASKIDFRDWEANAVIDAWKQHGSMEKCVANVGSNASDPKMYCGLLQVAASEAERVVKTAAAKPATKAEPKAPVYKKIAKLTSEEQSFLREYFSKIYGNEYVEALLSDY